ncbi:hypothetical protein [uncultured Methylophaga sp.]|uniref:hypothetical protein n=1 Tax=uncultured Methylophaga sp. TaxID=285271 RepID=UPI0030F6A811
MKYKNWTIEPDGIYAEFVAYHDNYDPTPVHPSDPMSDVDHIFCGTSVEDCIKQINEVETVE